MARIWFDTELLLLEQKQQITKTKKKFITSKIKTRKHEIYGMKIKGDQNIKSTNKTKINGQLIF